MILPNLNLPSRANQRWKFSGIDQLTNCLDKNHFKTYPYDIEYAYNSRGFRGPEWPTTIEKLKQSIWCVGDSFTVGIGSPESHSWPGRLRDVTHQNVINVSMDGASNEWIARITEEIINKINPANIIIMWSYTHRREIDNPALSDEARRQSTVARHELSQWEKINWENFVQCQTRVKSAATNMQFAIPYFHPDCDFNINAYWSQICDPSWPSAPTSLEDIDRLPQKIKDEIANIHGGLDKIQRKLKCNLSSIVVEQLDLARDGCHFDLATSNWVVSQILPNLNS